MPFDSNRYNVEYLKTRDAKQGLSEDDLLERYAIDLNASEAEIAAQVKAVRIHWNGFRSKAGSRAAAVAMLCCTADEELLAEHGEEMLRKTWWLQKADERKKKAAASVGKIAEQLKSAYGQLGVVTQASLDAATGHYGLSRQQVIAAAQEAGLEIVPSRQLPKPAVPAKRFEAIEINLNACGSRTIPELLHPRSGEFRILEGYECLGDAQLRLDLPAVVTQFDEVQKEGASTANGARREVLQFLKSAAADGVDLTELALAHLVDLGRGSIRNGSTAALDRLTDLGVERTDAATIVALLEEQEEAAGAAGVVKVDRLLDEGRLGEARQAAENMPSESKERENAIAKVAAARARLDDLSNEIRAAVQAGEEGRAESLVNELGKISGEDAEAALGAVPLAPVGGLRLVANEVAVRLHWQPGGGSNGDTTYIVTRSERSAPASPVEGKEVARSTQVSTADQHPPVARLLHYSVFAMAPQRPSSRAATAAITILPPVAGAAADVGPSDVTVRWSTHPDCVGVEVQRTEPGAAPTKVKAKQNSCHIDGLPEGVPVHLEIVALYRDSTGSERRSDVTHVDATPRSAAKPLPKLRARPIDAGGEVRARVAWAPIDSSEVRIYASAAPPPWPAGTWIGHDDLAHFGGAELTGPRATGGTEVTLDAELDAGIHHLFAVSLGGTGIVVGAAAMVGVTAPIRNPVVTSFGTYATLSWEWPPTAQIAEVRSEVDDEVDLYEITRAAYQTDGGAKVKLGGTVCKVEVRAMIHTQSGSFASPAVAIRIDDRNEAEIRYRIFSSGLGKRSKRITFVSDSGCAGVPVRMVVAPGSVMPISAGENFILLDERLDLAPGKPTEFKVTVPKAISKPRWVRCFSLDGNARLLDPPISELKD